MKISNVNLTSSTISASGKDNHKVRKSNAGSFSDNLGSFERENEREQLQEKLKEH